MAMSTDSIDELVKEESESWELTKLYWFVEDQDDKTPGEFER